MVNFLIEKFKNLIYKDNCKENESKTLVVTLRLVVFSMSVYFIILCTTLAILQYFNILMIVLPCFILYLFVFYSTFVCQTKTSFYIYSCVTLFWIFLCVCTLGWDFGVQHLIFPLLVISFFSMYDNVKFKILYCIFLCLYRLALYSLSNFRPPTFSLFPSDLVFLQVLNTVFTFISISILCWCFSSKTQEAEKKLFLYNLRLQKEASTDHLTKLINRRKMLEYLKEDIHKIESGQFTSLSIALGDIDFFKKVNDSMGHECGDVVLQKLSALFMDFMEGKGLVARWGGEEFLFAFENMNGDEASVLLNKMLLLIRKLNIDYQSERVSVTMTFGLEEFDMKQGLEHCIQRADDKLYMGKNSGRNKVIY